MSSEQIWQLAAGTMVATVFLLMIDAVVGTRWDVPQGFWAVPPAVFGFLGAALAFTGKRNGNGNGKGPGDAPQTPRRRAPRGR